MLQKLFPAYLLLINSLFLKLLCNLDLSCNGRMVCARLPQGRIALHSLKSDKYILHRIVQGMSHMELSCYVWRWHHYGKWLLALVYLCVKILLFLPLLVNPVLYLGRIISLL